MSLTQTQLNGDILRIKVLHGRLGDDWAKSLAYHTGGWWYLRFLQNKVHHVGICIRILERYDADASDEDTNVISDADAEAIIDSCYRECEEWNT